MKRTELGEFISICMRLLPLCCSLTLCSHAQWTVQSALSLPFPEQKAEMRSRLLALGSAGISELTQDIVESEIESGYELARKSFLINVALDYEDRVAKTVVTELLNEHTRPLVIMLTVRELARRRDSRYLGELIKLLEDTRVARTISSPVGDRPVTVRKEVIEALGKITDAAPLKGQVTEEQQAVYWQRWWKTRLP